MSQGKVKAALRLLSSESRGKVLHPDDIAVEGESEGVQPKTVLDVLKEKHPRGSSIDPEALLNSAPAPSHPVVFEKLTGETIRHAALHCQGAAGPSGLDASCWRRLCTMFHGASKQLCEALATATKRMCTSYIDPEIIRPFIACRLIPLSKNPGVRPIGICDTLRRIMGKAILSVIGPEIQAIAGCTQLCARQRSGCEAAVHAMEELMKDESVEGILLVDARNAFNSLNREVMLRNIQVTCPSLAVPVINMYGSNAELFVGNDTILSQEGMTQGDPLSMVVYALSTLPLIARVSQPNLTQTWFADDAGAGASLESLHRWWTALSEVGPKYGYHVSPPKTWLLVKDQHKEAARTLFMNSGIKITTEGRPVLGAPIGTPEFTANFIEDMVTRWRDELKVLTSFATTQPQAAFAAYTHGLAGKWSYLSRACSMTEEQFHTLEAGIRREFIPAFSGRAVSDVERDLLGLPARMGGLGLLNPAVEAETAHTSACKVTKPLVDSLLGRTECPMAEVFSDQNTASIESRRAKAGLLKNRSTSVKDCLPHKMQRAVLAAEEKGASSWLTALPLADFGFSLSKSDFRDALHLRYGWTPPRLPTACVCGQPFHVDHALSCSHGGYLGLRHNEVRDLLGEVLEDTCVNVCLEPALKPLEGEKLSPSANSTENARVDIQAGGFWGASRHERAYFDVRVFYPHARSHCHRSLPQIYRSQEMEKRRQYQERILNVDGGTFTPLVFSAMGGAGPAASTFLKCLADKIATKKSTTYAQALGWLRCRLSFALLRSSLLCLRGARSIRPSDAPPEPRQPDLAMVEAQIKSA